MPPKPRIERLARARLKDALERLTADTAHRPPRVTVSELCRLAEVSRNSLYRYHAPILAMLRRHQPRKSARIQARRAAEYRRRENEKLREQITQLVALVDHYFAAYRETTTLLERRERELAQLRKQLPAWLTVVSSRSGHRH
jgi:AcrR family transcriptional regulator